MSLIRQLRYCDKQYRKNGRYYDKRDIQSDIDWLELALMDLM